MQFDFFASPTGQGFLLDIQSNLLDRLKTRVVVPLLPVDLFRRLVANLNPVFEIEEQRVAMMTEFMAAMPLRELGEVRGSLAGHRDQIVRAVDVLLIGV
jgi:toxin CcdB